MHPEIKLKLTEKEWLALKRAAAAGNADRIRVKRDLLDRLLRDHTKLVEACKTKIDWLDALEKGSASG